MADDLDPHFLVCGIAGCAVEQPDESIERGPCRGCEYVRIVAEVNGLPQQVDFFGPVVVLASRIVWSCASSSSPRLTLCEMS
ncbi:hypothetical protein [Thauera sp. SDU_THAU2]|uniref:hypothetical protein n=1 Tax=Thauera sp. SDU_THAU2 TaxID=3136633 RepID=UPI00311F70E6